MLYVQNPDPVTSERRRVLKPGTPILAPNIARLLALVLLAVGARLAYIGTQPDASHLGSTDAWGYHRLALNLDLYHRFSLHREAPFEPDSVRTPLYPLSLLASRRLFGPHPRTAAIAQAILDGVSTLLTYQLTVRLAAILGFTAARRAGRAAALLYALNPVQIRQVNELLTETLLSCLLLLGLILVLRYIRIRHTWPLCTRRRDQPARTALAIGAAAALAALCKPNVQYLPLVWVPVVVVASPLPPKHRWRDAALLVAAFLVSLSPWVIRNQVVFGRPFFSTAFQGNVSRISAPATLLTARGQYAIPWSAEWESAFGEIVAQASERYEWSQPWESMDARAKGQADYDVYLVARQVLVQHPAAWFISHLQGTLRYLEPKTYRSLYAHWTGNTWPPDVLDDALIHITRALVHGEWDQAGRIIAEERWNRLTPLQRAIWWSQLAALVLAITLALRGVWTLRQHPALLLAIAGTVVYVLLVPGPIAYERFRTPVLGPILALATLPFASPYRPCYNQREQFTF